MRGGGWLVVRRAEGGQGAGSRRGSTGKEGLIGGVRGFQFSGDAPISRGKEYGVAPFV